MIIFYATVDKRFLKISVNNFLYMEESLVVTSILCFVRINILQQRHIKDMSYLFRTTS